MAIPRGGWLVAGIALGLALTVVGVGSAEVLQGRLLQRSDGAFFIIRNGAKYAVEPAGLSDDEIDAIPDGTGALFTAAPAAAANPPQPAASDPPVATNPPAASNPPVASNAPAPQLDANLNLITLSGSIKVAVPPAPFNVTKQQDGLVVFSQYPLGSEIDVIAIPSAHDPDALLQSAKQQFEALSHQKPEYGLIQDVSPAGEASSLRSLGFKGQATGNNGVEFYSGSLVAVMRPDLPIAVISTALNGFEHDTIYPVSAIIASLEQ